MDKGEMQSRRVELPSIRTSSGRVSPQQLRSPTTTPRASNVPMPPLPARSPASPASAAATADPSSSTYQLRDSSPRVNAVYRDDSNNTNSYNSSGSKPFIQLFDTSDFHHGGDSDASQRQLTSPDLEQQQQQQNSQQHLPRPCRASSDNRMSQTSIRALTSSNTSSNNNNNNSNNATGSSTRGSGENVGFAGKIRASFEEHGNLARDAELDLQCAVESLTNAASGVCSEFLGMSASEALAARISDCAARTDANLSFPDPLAPNSVAADLALALFPRIQPVAAQFFQQHPHSPTGGFSGVLGASATSSGTPSAGNSVTSLLAPQQEVLFLSKPKPLGAVPPPQQQQQQQKRQAFGGGGTPTPTRIHSASPNQTLASSWSGPPSVSRSQISSSNNNLPGVIDDIAGASSSSSMSLSSGQRPPLQRESTLGQQNPTSSSSIYSLFTRSRRGASEEAAAAASPSIGDPIVTSPSSGSGGSLEASQIFPAPLPPPPPPPPFPGQTLSPGGAARARSHGLLPLATPPSRSPSSSVSATPRNEQTVASTGVPNISFSGAQSNSNSGGSGTNSTGAQGNNNSSASTPPQDLTLPLFRGGGGSLFGNEPDNSSSMTNNSGEGSSSEAPGSLSAMMMIPGVQSVRSDAGLAPLQLQSSPNTPNPHQPHQGSDSNNIMSTLSAIASDLGGAGSSSSNTTTVSAGGRGGQSISLFMQASSTSSANSSASSPLTLLHQLHALQQQLSQQQHRAQTVTKALAEALLENAVIVCRAQQQLTLLRAGVEQCLVEVAAKTQVNDEEKQKQQEQEQQQQRRNSTKARRRSQEEEAAAHLHPSFDDELLTSSLKHKRLPSNSMLGASTHTAVGSGDYVRSVRGPRGGHDDDDDDDDEDTQRVSSSSSGEMSPEQQNRQHHDDNDTYKAFDESPSSSPFSFTLTIPKEPAAVAALNATGFKSRTSVFFADDVDVGEIAKFISDGQQQQQQHESPLHKKSTRRQSSIATLSAPDGWLGAARRRSSAVLPHRRISFNVANPFGLGRTDDETHNNNNNNSNSSRKSLPIDGRESVMEDSSERHAIVESSKADQAEDCCGMELLNGYLLLEEVGCGSTAAVLRALDTERDGREVAIKVIPRPRVNPDANSSLMRQQRLALRNLKAEVKVLKRMFHKNLVKLYEVIDDADHGSIFLVQEFLGGGPLAKANFDGSFDRRYLASDCVRAGRVLCAAIVYAHEHGVAHRDIKHENVLLRAPPKRGVRIDPVVVDFGVASLVNCAKDAATGKLPTLQRRKSSGATASVLGSGGGARGSRESFSAGGGGGGAPAAVEQQMNSGGSSPGAGAAGLEQVPSSSFIVAQEEQQQQQQQRHPASATSGSMRSMQGLHSLVDRDISSNTLVTGEWTSLAIATDTTRAYLPPEVINSSMSGGYNVFAADVYAIGLVIYGMLWARLPFCCAARDYAARVEREDVPFPPQWSMNKCNNSNNNSSEAATEDKVPLAHELEEMTNGGDGAESTAESHVVFTNEQLEQRETEAFEKNQRRLGAAAAAAAAAGSGEAGEDEIPPELIEILKMMLHRDPAQRCGIEEARARFKALDQKMNASSPLNQDFASSCYETTQTM